MDASSSSRWACAPDWLLHSLVSFLSEPDLYCLWLCAVEGNLPALRSFLHRKSPFAPLDIPRATHTAMVHGCWKTLCILSGVDHNAPVGRCRLRARTVDRILQELHRLKVPLLPNPHRRLAMLTAAARGSVPAFVMYAAAQRGHVESVVWLHHVAAHDPFRALDAAASHGHHAVVTWILTRGLDPPSNSNRFRHVRDVLEFHSRSHIHITVWGDMDPKNGRAVSMFSPQWGFASQYSSKRVYPIADIAARHGDVDVIQEILAHPSFQDAYSSNAVENAADNGHLHILQWFKAHRRDAFHNSIALRLAIGNGHVKVAEWLTEHRLGGSTLLSLSEAIATKGDLSTLQWMMTTFPAIQPVEVALHAARAGHRHIIEWLVATRRLDASIRLAKAASERGHIGLVQWLLARCEDDDVDISVLMCAASSGSCALVQWLVETYKCWDPILFSWASRTSSTETLAYLYDLAVVKSHELDLPLTSMLRVKREAWIYNAQYETLSWLLRRGFCEGILNKRSFQEMLLVERAYAKQQQQVGWMSGYARAVSVSEIIRFRDMMQAIIELYDPSSLRKVAWLPEWAVRQRSLALLGRLLTIHHPQLFSRKVFRMVLRSTNDASVMKWFLLQKPSLFSTHVVKWAIAHENAHLLQWILDDFVRTRLGTSLDNNLLQNCQRVVARERLRGFEKQS